MESNVTPSTTIVMEPEKVTVSIIDEQGMKTVKNTNIENIQQIFMKEQAMETPLLPSQWGVVKYYRKNNYEGYIMTTPPTEREVNFSLRENGIPNKTIIPVPPMLWIFEVREDREGRKSLQHSMCYAMKHELLSMKDQLLHAPYPNIGIGHGICWGMELPPATTGKSLQNIPARFFSSPFNYDLSSGRVKSFRYFREAEDREIETDTAIYHMVKLAKDLANSRESGEAFVYPFDTLKEGNNLTVEQAAKMYMPAIFN
ncbi:hypothetical protein ABFV99_13890 [Cytobacillus horneckiae]|uniref:hypothetical protein n=1 Tax=Cytobacillus horneckiae TaxID=549687 RepID=UPI0034CDBB42